MQAGQKLAVRLRAARPDGSVVRAPAVASFYAPGKDPERLPADRVPDRVVPLVFDADSRLYGAEVSTAGWAPGVWTYCGTVSDGGAAPAGWGFCRFTLRRLYSAWPRIDGLTARGLEFGADALEARFPAARSGPRRCGCRFRLTREPCSVPFAGP